MRTKTTYRAALLVIICLGVLASVAHVDAWGARPFIKEDVGYYDDEMHDGSGSMGDAIGGIILVVVHNLGYYEDGYYDDEPYDGSIVDSIVGIILLVLFLGMFWGGIAFLSYLINRLRRH